MMVHEKLPYDWPKNKPLPTLAETAKAVRILERNLRMKNPPRPMKFINEGEAVIINI